MRAESAGGRPGLVAAALARAEAWLFEPADVRTVAQPVVLPPRPIVAVVSLRGRCGATTLARALAARLAARDPGGSAVVAGSDHVIPPAPAVRTAARLAGQMNSGGSAARAAGRLCLTDVHDFASLASLWRRVAPLVLDVPPDVAPSGPSSLADLTILVAPGDGEPALAELAARSLSRLGGQPVIVVSRPDQPACWEGRAAVSLPHTRAGARLAAAGWDPPGPLGAAVAELGELCEAAVCA